MADTAETDSIFRIPLRSRRSQSGHMTRGRTLDLSHLRDGRSSAGGVRPHSGRPVLATQIVTANRRKLGIMKKSQARIWVRSISYLFATLDIIEAKLRLPRVDDVCSIPGAVWNAFSDHLNDDTDIALKSPIYIECAAAICTASELAGAPAKLPTSPHPTRKASARRSVETAYSPEVERAIVSTFRTERRRVQERVSSAHELADNGDDSLAKLIARGEAAYGERKLIATRENVLRFVRDNLLSWLPSTTAFEKEYGFQPRRIGQPPEALSAKLDEVEAPVSGVRREAGSGLGLAALYRWFLPHHFDLVPFIVELVHCTHLNLGPVLDIDRHNWCSGDPASGSVTVFSRKARSRGAIVAIESSTVDPDAPYALIKSAITLTQPLHDLVEKELVRLEAGHKDEDTEHEIARLRSLRNRVWISLGLKPIRPQGIDPEADPFHDIANEILRRHGVTEGGEPVRWSARRVRDAFLDRVDQESRSHVRVLKDALQHQHRGLTGRYRAQPQIAGRDCKTIWQRLSELMEPDPDRAARWPTTAGQGDRIGSASRTTLLVLPAGRRWLSAAGSSSPVAQALPELTQHGGPIWRT